MSSIIKGLRKEGQIYSTGGGAGQSYRKFTPKSAGVEESSFKEEHNNYKSQIQNIIKQNPRGSAAEKIVLDKFLNSQEGTYARNVIGKDNEKWTNQIIRWLKTNKPWLQQQFSELDFNDLESLAYDMYETYLARQGQIEENLLAIDDQYKKESSIMKGLQTEDKKKALTQLDTEINDLIKKIWSTEIPSIQDQGRYLVYSANYGLEFDTTDLDDAIYSAKQISQKNIHAPTLVYDRKTKFPVAIYKGSEDIWTQDKKLHEVFQTMEGYSAGVPGGAFAQKSLYKEDVERLAQLEMAFRQAKEITKGIKYDETVNGIIVEIEQLAQKYDIDPESIKYAVSDVLEARNNLESAVYGLDEVFKDAYQEAKWNQEDQEETYEGYSAGVTGGSGLGIDKSPIEKVYEKPFYESNTKQKEAMDEIEKLNRLAEKYYELKQTEKVQLAIDQAIKIAKTAGVRYRRDRDGIAIATRGVDENTVTKNLEEVWSKKYKQSINCSNPKGFSQKAHCAGRKARQAGKHTKSKSVNK